LGGEKVKLTDDEIKQLAILTIQKSATIGNASALATSVYKEYQKSIKNIKNLADKES
jgi:hypothetical protein